jgi:hypothetical protein
MAGIRQARLKITDVGMRCADYGLRVGISVNHGDQILFRGKSQVFDGELRAEWGGF